MRSHGGPTTVVGTASRNLVYVDVDTDDGLAALGGATLRNVAEAGVAQRAELALLHTAEGTIVR